MTRQHVIDLIAHLDLSTGPYPTVVGLGVRALFTAGAMWLLIGRPATLEVTT